MVVARRVVVSGRVQGVGFRYFVQEAARVEGAWGWVRNLSDGRVEMLLEGEREAIERLERRVRRGPSSAAVTSVTVEECAPSEHPGAFEVRA
jgi:acylphosphatase